ncbi:recombinase RecT [Collinsella sp. AGMB00827]|uniref:Recombinase RecT n=1 Tax=Collinsella ureilytica TaxID=2869515 RepID=A0ABS7MMQ6_9ACTN|nr:recombinase RecT [Collinsella urealyticum]MBY4798323.1 recombinase RecT [Collinsella urealyticum]
MGAIAKASTEIKKSENTGFKGLLERNWNRISAVAPRHMNRDRMFQLALSAYNQTPELAQCSPASVLGCLMKCTALGMEPSAVDGLGRAYILPFNNKKTGRKEATFILGYKGMIDLARRSGELRDISARVVHEGDEFEYEYGLNETLRHVPSTEPIDNRPLTHVYMVAHFKDGGHYIDVMTKQEVEAVKRRSKAGKYGPWATDYEAMAMKSVIRRAFKFLPVSVEGAEAAAADETVQVFNEEEDMPLIETQPNYETEEVPEGVDPETGEVVDAQPAESQAKPGSYSF